ncbi:hypothetical protein BJ875DRAFT_543276 [Amylocarpus encephaloides]|uniref:Uncharacterized protein n=1 Tax=Amylocarpus encephaloides TaxID=45428 RepID=A0A9P8C4Y7_9HELO|nr:hypothetical protein BJ875DRAFT_543276 [Amylocarpus encephaloides]
MSASSTVSSSALSRSTTAILFFTTVIAAYATYLVYTSSDAEDETNPLSSAGLQRSNAVHRRRRRNQENENDPPSVFVDDEPENLEGRLVPLADGETIVDEHGFGEEHNVESLPPTYQRSGQNIVQLLFRVSEDATRRNAYVHRGCACNSCGTVPIRGIRYRCSNCADYDLCEGCESQGLHIKTHIFYKIRVPGPSFGPKNIQPVWYAGDPDSVTRVLSKETTTKLSRETGFERPELDAYWEQWTFMASTDWRDDPDKINLAMDRKTFERCLVPFGEYRHTSPSLIFDRMFAFYDTNKDDLIGFPEFLHGIGYRKKKDKWARIFEGYDIDGDGYVERRDFLRIFRSYYVLYRQMHKDMLEGMEEQHMSCVDAHRLVTSRQPLSSAFGQDGRYPRAPDPRTGEGKSVQVNGELEITDGRGVVSESRSDTGNREDIFRQNIMTLSRYHQLSREQGRQDPGPRNRSDGGYWETIFNPPQTEAQLSSVARNMRRLREQAHHVLQGRINASLHSLEAVFDDDGESDSDMEDDPAGPVDPALAWIPSYVTVTDEDAEAVDGPGTRVADVQPASQHMVIAHAAYRERAQREIYDRWKRRQFYTDEEEGAIPPTEWKEEDDVLVHTTVTGESSKSQSRPSFHSRSSSKVRFAEDMDDLDTRSNPSTSSRNVPERWGGMEIPDAERDAGKEILYQVTQQAFNELLDPLFKEKEDLAVRAAETVDKRDKFKPMFSTPQFEQWALARETEETRKKTSTQSTTTREGSRPAFPSLHEVEVEEVRQRPLRELLESTGYQIGPQGRVEDPSSDSIFPSSIALEQAGWTAPEELGSGHIGEDFLPLIARERVEASLPSPIHLPISENHATTPADAPPVAEACLVTDTEDPLTPTSSGSEPHPDTPSDTTSSSYHDPTLPQFRPNGPRFSRFAEDLSESPSPSGRCSPIPASTTKQFDEDSRPPKDVLYHLWKCDKACREAKEKGGWGRLSFREFENLINSQARVGKAKQMEYLGSWIDLCIP